MYDVVLLAGDETLMEQALEAASSAVAALGYAGEKLDVIAKSGHKRCTHLPCVFVMHATEAQDMACMTYAWSGMQGLRGSLR